MSAVEGSGRGPEPVVERSKCCRSPPNIGSSDQGLRREHLSDTADVSAPLGSSAPGLHYALCALSRSLCILFLITWHFLNFETFVEALVCCVHIIEDAVDEVDCVICGGLQHAVER